VRILVLVTRYPRPHAKGDQQRALSWICDLAQRHEVSVVVAAPEPAGDSRLPDTVRVVPMPAGAPARLMSAVAAGVRGVPLQVGWMMPRGAWRAATRAAHDADVVLAITSRSLRGPVGRPLVVDHVDALSLNMARRAHGDEALIVRMFARWEAARFRGWERRCARWSTAALATSEEDAGALPPEPHVEVVPVGLDEVDETWSPPSPTAAADRPIDVVLSGNMRYPPNRRAALLLERDIAPGLRARVPGVRVVVAGRGADALGLTGVEVMSDVPDMRAVLRTAKVALAPLELGTGSPYKVLEAAACGAAIVSSPWAAERFGLPALTAHDVEGYVDALCLLLSDPARRAALVVESQAAVRAHGTHELARRLELLLERAAADG